MIVLCQCRFISYNKCTAQVGDADSWGVCGAWEEQEVYGKSLYFLLNLSVNIKLLIKSLFSNDRWCTYIYVRGRWLQKSVGHRRSQMVDPRVQLPPLRANKGKQPSVPEELDFAHVQQRGLFIFFPVCFPTLWWLDWPPDQFQPRKCEWTQPLSLLSQSTSSSMPKSLGFSFSAVATVEGHTGMERLKGQSRLRCQAGDLQSNHWDKPAAPTGLQVKQE